MLTNYYPIQSQQSLQEYLVAYIPLVLYTASLFNINLKAETIVGDHFGLQVLSKQEFDLVSKQIDSYSILIHDTIVHERRNRVFKLKDPCVSQYISFSSIEIFEPKPNADISKLKPGIEHLAFNTADYDNLLSIAKQNSVPIDKEGEFNKGSKFFKTSFVNLVEIEFRNDHLGE